MLTCRCIHIQYASYFIGRWKQFALVSVGFVGCDNHYLPDFPNAVYPYLDWISSVTGNILPLLFLFMTEAGILPAV